MESLFNMDSYDFSELEGHFKAKKTVKRAHTFAIEVFSDATDWKSGSAVTNNECCPVKERIQLSTYNPIYHYRPKLSPALEWAIEEGHILKGGVVVYICTNEQRKLSEIGDVVSDYVEARKAEIYSCRVISEDNEEIDPIESLKEVRRVLAYIAFRRRLPESDPKYLDAVTIVIDDGSDYEEWFMDSVDIATNRAAKRQKDPYRITRDWRTYGARKKHMKVFVNDIMSKIHGHLIYIRKQKPVTEIKKKLEPGEKPEPKKFALDQEEMRTPDGMKELHFELSMSLRHFRPSPDQDPLVKIVRSRYHPTEATDLGPDEDGEPYFEPDYPYFTPSMVNLWNIIQRSVLHKLQVQPPEGVEFLHGPESYYEEDDEEDDEDED